MGLRVSLAEVLGPQSPARAPKIDPAGQKPLAGGFRDYYDALTSPRRYAVESGTDVPPPDATKAKPDSKPTAEDVRASGTDPKKVNDTPVGHGRGAAAGRHNAKAEGGSPVGHEEKEPTGDEAGDSEGVLKNTPNTSGDPSTPMVVPVPIVMKPLTSTEAALFPESQSAEADAESAVSSSPRPIISTAGTLPGGDNWLLKLPGAFISTPRLVETHSFGTPVAPALQEEDPTASTLPPRRAGNPIPSEAPDSPLDPPICLELRRGGPTSESPGLERSKPAISVSPEGASKPPTAPGELGPKSGPAHGIQAPTAAIGSPTADPESAFAGKGESPRDGGGARSGLNIAGQVTPPRSLAGKSDLPLVVDHASAIESDKADLPQSIAVRAASGDRAAVDIGRFLVLQVSADAVTTDGPVSAGVSDHRASVSPARHIGAHGAQLSQTSGTVADIFGAPVESTIPNDIAARVLSAGSARGVQHATLQLDPPELGQMRIDIRLREHGMTLRIDADHLAAARMIESRVSELRDSLAAHGIRVERCEVTLRPPEAPHANSGQDDGRSSSGDGEAHSRQHSSQWLDDGRRFAGSRDDGPRDDAGFGLLGGRPADGSTDGDRLESARLGFMANGVVNLVA